MTESFFHVRWCLGCVTYEMIVGLPPFYCQDWERMYDLILHADLTFPTLISPKCTALLQGYVNDAFGSME